MKKQGVEEVEQATEREQTGAQQCRVVARSPRQQHDTEAGRIQAAEGGPLKPESVNHFNLVEHRFPTFRKCLFTMFHVLCVRSLIKQLT